MMSYPLFFIVFYTLSYIFVILYDIIQFKDVFLNVTILADATLTFVSSVTMLVMFSVSCSMIPETLSEIRLSARNKINEHVFSLTSSIPKNALLCLSKIESEEIIYVSLCGMFHLKKAFNLTAVRVIFT